MRSIASVAIVVGLAALLGCRGLVELGSEPQPDGSTPSSGGVMMSSSDSSSAPTAPPMSSSDSSTSGSDSSSAPTAPPMSSSDSSSAATAPPMISSDSSSAPTWTQIYTDYLQAGTTGNCATGSCHSLQMPDPQSAYSYLQAYISGTSSILVKTGSCLSWYGGNMPPGGPRTDAMATTDMNAWAAAGAMNN